MMANVRHTTLMQVEKPGTAHFVVAHPAILDKGNTLVSSKLQNFDPGDMVTVSISYTPKRRTIMNVRACPLNSANEFLANYKNTLERQANKHQYNHDRYWAKDEEHSIEINIAGTDPQVVRPVVLSDRWIDEVYFTKEILVAFETAYKVTVDGEQLNMLMVGPSGYGKTTLPETFAAHKGMKFLRVNCAAIRDPEEWLGYREAINGNTVFVPTEFSEVVQAGNAIIVLDEFNRIEPWLTNTLYPLLDHARKTSIHGTEIECGPNVLFVATINQGFQFTGTFMLDAALTNRFDITVHVGSLQDSIETKLLVERYGVNTDQASSIVRVMKRLRQLNDNGTISIDASTRTSLKVARLVAAGVADIEEVFNFVVVNTASEDDIKEVTDTVRALVNPSSSPF